MQRYNKKFECATFFAVLFILLCNVGILNKQKHRKQNKNSENIF